MYPLLCIYLALLLPTVLSRNVSLDGTGNITNNDGPNSVYWHNIWTSVNLGSTFAAHPTLCHIGPDSAKIGQVATASVDGELLLVDMNTGHAVEGSGWPVYRYGEHFFSSPLIYDFNVDSHEEVIFISHSGHILAYDWKGILIREFELPSIYVRKDWNKSSDLLTGSELKQVVSLTKPVNSINYFVMVPEIFTSALIGDLNGDDRWEELAMAINFAGIAGSDFDDSLLAALLIFNLTTMKVSFVKPLELTYKSGEYPGYVMADPIMADVVSHIPGVELLVTVASGRVYLLSGVDGLVLSGFPVEYGPLHTKIVLIDRTMPGSQRVDQGFVVADINGHVLALDKSGRQLWEYDSGRGTSTTLARVAYVKGQQALVFATSNGQIHAIWSSDGKRIDPTFPLHFNNMSFSTQGLVYGSYTGHHIGFLSTSGHFCSISLGALHTQACTYLGESSHLSPLLLPPRDRADMLVLSKDGVLIRVTPTSHKIYSLHERLFLQHVSTNDVFIGVHLTSGKHSSVVKATGSSLSIDLSVLSGIYYPLRFMYTVKVLLGPHLLHTTQITSPSSSIHIPIGNRVLRGRVVVVITTDTGHVISDSVWLSINWEFLEQLPALLYLPTVCLLVGLLVLTLTRERDLLLPIVNRDVTNVARVSAGPRLLLP